MAPVIQTYKNAGNNLFMFINDSSFDIWPFAAKLEKYDACTYLHSLNVAKISLSIGRVFNLSDQQLVNLAICAFLHDIGKTLMPIQIINKPGILTAMEYNFVKSHSIIGGEYLKHNSVFDKEVLTGVMHHHEKFDGSGYPNGLMNNEIPFFSRIVSIADVYDAVTSLRPYRKPVSPTAALDLIMYEMKSAFDKQIIGVLSSVINLK